MLAETNRKQLAFQAIASHLVVHEHGEVALIATTDPPLAHLRDILIVRLQRSRRGPAFTESGYVYKKHVTTTPPTRDTMDRISKMLEHVQISRVFDFAGVVEAVSEFSANVDENARTNDEKLDENDHKGPRSIADSEDEAMDDLSAEQELNALTEDKPNTSKKPAANMLVIDNIANVLGSMMTKSQVQGAAYTSAHSLT